MLCPMTQVEETKQMIKMIPVFLTMLMPSIVIAQLSTLLLKVATTLDRSIGPHFVLPPASLAAVVTISMLISLVVYDRCFVPVARRYTNNPRGITLLQRIGIGLVLHIIFMVITSLVERKRLSVARENQLLGKDDTVPLTVFILFPQLVLIGIADSFLETAKLEFFYDQAPQGMKSLGTSYFTSSIGVGSFLSSVLLTTVSNFTKRNGHKGWILGNLNVSHLDYYFGLLAFLSFLNLLVYFVVAKSFGYNADVETKTDLAMETSFSVK